MKKWQSFITNRHFFTFMMGVLFLLLLLMVFFTYTGYANTQKVRERLTTLSNEIEVYDLYLTNDSINYVLTNQSTYKDKYHEAYDYLTTLFDDAKSFDKLTPILIQLEEIHVKLNEFEEYAMKSKDISVFSLADYQTLKDNYQQLTLQLQSKTIQLANQKTQTFVYSITAFLLVGTLFSFFVLGFLLFFGHRLQKKYQFFKHLQRCTTELLSLQTSFSNQNFECMSQIFINEFKANVVGIINQDGLESWFNEPSIDHPIFIKDIFSLLHHNPTNKRTYSFNSSTYSPDIKMFLKKYQLTSCWVIQNSYINHRVTLVIGFTNTLKRMDSPTISFLLDLCMLLSMMFSRIKHEEQLFILATTDSLTNIYNLRMFKEKLTKEKSRHKRFSLSSCLMVLDLDHFKTINDTHGHDIGDEILTHFVDNVLSCIRDIDIFGRIGGEEFAIFLPTTTIKQAYNVAYRILETVEKTPYVFGNLTIEYTVSIGLTSIINQSTSIEDDMKKADYAMYLAKSHGRNRIEIL